VPREAETLKRWRIWSFEVGVEWGLDSTCTPTHANKGPQATLGVFGAVPSGGVLGPGGLKRGETMHVQSKQLDSFSPDSGMYLS
jgi:hypothetical protein